MISMTLDTREFDKAMDEYMKFQKRLPADVINAKLYYIARNATILTKASDKSKIESELSGPSKSYPEVPLAAILVNSQLRKGGGKGLTGKKMAKAVEKFISKRKNSVNFIRSGWKNAIVILENYLRTKGELNIVRRWGSSSPADKETMKKRNFENLGKAKPALITMTPRAWGEIQNDAGSNKSINISNLDQIKLNGLQKGIDKEVRSMQLYIQRKLDPVHKEFNRKQGF